MLMFDVQRALFFLKTNMFNTTDKLVRESTKETGNNYYMNSANGLAFTALYKHDHRLAMDLLEQAYEVKFTCGRNSSVLCTLWADLLHPLWKGKTRTIYTFRNNKEEFWKPLKEGTVKNNNASESARKKTENKLNVKCLYLINSMLSYYSSGLKAYLSDAAPVWNSVIQSFDDAKGGYVDEIADYREVYKQMLVKIISDHFPELADIGKYQEPTGLWDNYLQDPDNGGVFMRYIRDKDNRIVDNGSTYQNTESTAVCIIAHCPECINFY